MEEDTKTIIAGIVIVALLFIGFALMLNWSKKNEERQRQENIQEINKCLDKTSDRDWCFDKFLR